MILGFAVNTFLPTCAGWLAIGVCAIHVQAAVPQPVQTLDESEFRAGLRERGLTDWLEQYLADTPPLDDADRRLRLREELLAKANKKNLPANQRQAIMTKADSILAALIKQHPEHPARLRWQFEWARDFLERRAPESFDRLLLYELPGRDRQTVNQLSTQAIETLEALRQGIADAWSALESMDEQAIETATASGQLRSLETIDAQSAMLLTWARLYRSLTADLSAPEHISEYAAILTEVTEHHGWTQLPAGYETQQCSALLMAAMAARFSGDPTAADHYARQIIALLPEIKNPHRRRQLRRITLLAILEQIRAMRDSGNVNEALSAVMQAKQWAQQSRPDDITTALALAFAERSVLLQQAHHGEYDPAPARATSQPQATIGSFWQPLAALAPLERIVTQSLTYRDALYAVLAPSSGNAALSDPPSPLATQLLLGATVMDVMQRKTDGTQELERLKYAIKTTQNMLASAKERLTALTQGEILFLLGRGFYVSDEPMAAIASLCELAETFPDHDRAGSSAEQATFLAQEQLRNTRRQNMPAARAAFVRAAQLLQKRSPTSHQAKHLQYFIALAMENNDQLEQAADAYAMVSADDINAMRSQLGRTRCLRNVLQQAVNAHTLAEQDLQELAHQAVQAARDAVSFAKTHATAANRNEDHCLSAAMTLMLANLLNHPLIHQPSETLATLQKFENQYSDCPDATAPALRERITALRELKRLAEARHVVERYLATDPKSAGPVMTKLFEVMRDEMNHAANVGDTEKRSQIASEAVRLSQKIQAWAQQQPDRMSPQDALTLRIGWAWALRNAGQPDDALSAYQDCEARVTTSNGTHPAAQVEIQLGKAECLLSLDRPSDALPLFTTVWQQLPEQSPNGWRALVGSLQCHTRLGSDPQKIIQTIRQQRHLFPDLGGPRWTRELEALEQTNLARQQGNP